MHLHKHILSLLALFFIATCLLWVGVLWLLTQGQQQTTIEQSQLLLNNALHYRQQFITVLSLPPQKQPRILSKILMNIEDNEQINCLGLYDVNRQLIQSSNHESALLLDLDDYVLPAFGAGMVKPDKKYGKKQLTYITPLHRNNQIIAYLKISFSPLHLPFSVWQITLLSLLFFSFISIILIRIYFKLQAMQLAPLKQLQQHLSQVQVLDTSIEHTFHDKEQIQFNELEPIYNELNRLFFSINTAFSLLSNKQLGLIAEIQQRIKLLETHTKNIAELEQSVYTAKQNHKSMLLAQSEFTANISQQLRSPMNAILGMVEMLLGQIHKSENKQKLTVIYDGSKQLHAIIENLMSLSTIESGKMFFKNNAFDLTPLLKESIIKAHIPNKEMSVDIQIKQENDMPNRVRGDFEQIQAILINLINHALQLNQQSKVILEVITTQKDKHYAHLKFFVHYQGHEIEENNRDLLFSETGQFNFFEYKEKQPTLDLTLCHQMAQLMGGRIGYNSCEIGHSLWLKLLLPISNIAEKRIKTKRKRQEQQKHRFDQCHILLVEDNYTNQMVAKIMLRKMGCEVTLANNGAEALDLYPHKSYDLILMDIQMPILDGLEATKKIREQEKITGQHRIIIAITANALEREQQACFDAGMDDFLAKPISQYTLIPMLEKWLLQ